jgi:hypothetical protein
MGMDLLRVSDSARLNRAHNKRMQRGRRLGKEVERRIAETATRDAIVTGQAADARNGSCERSAVLDAATRFGTPAPGAVCAQRAG